MLLHADTAEECSSFPFCFFAQIQILNSQSLAQLAAIHADENFYHVARRHFGGSIKECLLCFDDLKRIISFREHYAFIGLFTVGRDHVVKVINLGIYFTHFSYPHFHNLEREIKVTSLAQVDDLIPGINQAALNKVNFVVLDLDFCVIVSAFSDNRLKY